MSFSSGTCCWKIVSSHPSQPMSPQALWSRCLPALATFVTGPANFTSLGLSWESPMCTWHRNIFDECCANSANTRADCYKRSIPTREECCIQSTDLLELLAQSILLQNVHRQSAGTGRIAGTLMQAEPETKHQLALLPSAISRRAASLWQMW